MVKQDYTWRSYLGEDSLSVWKSEEFFAVAFQMPPCVRLDIERSDKRDGITWDEMQNIKAECGFADCDAIEFYPRDSDVLNTGNFRHMYIFNERLPLILRN